ncbi:hypothetical protein [Actinomarinicola tropica]|uniref:DUF1795 domain-containing protein n=1 Tax=Actinomarinicola tropica TaxID=2789776 RepID=A0A5Q2RM16_9ACTN|nr:hypothetical protein [Actinomarinicola tropica]QGG96883.1 hypothetical protein GH723_18245 [Actinomarinicola tropica]
MNWRAIPVALLLVAGAAACGDDDGGEEGGLSDLTTTSVEETEETTTTTEADEEETTTTTEASDTEAPDGWTTVEQSEFTIALPPTWQEASDLIDDPEFGAQMQEIIGSEAQLEQMLAQLDLMAVDTESVASGFATNLNVIVNPASPADTIETLEQQVAPALSSSMGAEVTTTEAIELGGQEALRVEYDYPQPDGTLLKGLQFYVLGETLSGVITFTSSEDLVDLDAWTEVAETFTLAG